MKNAILDAPTLETRPRLRQEVFARRRREFMARIGAGAAIFRSAPPAARTHDTEYRYRQDSDFHYLTGFPEPDALCLLMPHHPERRYVLFVRPRDPEREVWDGRRYGPEAAKEVFGADAAHSIEELHEWMPKYLEHADLIHYRFGRDSAFDHRVFEWLKYFRQIRQRTGKGPYGLLDPAEVLHEMRLYKAPEELELMRHSAQIAARAHLEAMLACRPGMYEFEIEAIIENRFRREAAGAPAYHSIVGSGSNATILHYVENQSRMRDGDLLLVDAGAEYEHYCSDITRTYPVNGRFTTPQRQLYEVVLEAQKRAIEMVAPGVRFDQIHNLVVEILLDGLLRLGLLAADRETALKESLYKKFYMHRTSHWLGIDVHDAGKYRLEEESRMLEPGMVLTIEPGLYIPDAEDVPERFRAIGIRIEDDVLVTACGHEVLTHAVPKEVEELEAIVGRGSL